MPRDATDQDLARALDLISKEIRRRGQGHPMGHLLAGSQEEIRLRLDLPLSPSPSSLAEAVVETRKAIDRGLQEILVHRSVFRPGRVYCLRCRSAECEHSAPTAAKEVFAGYGVSGVPLFLDLGQYLLERHEPRIDRLYHARPELIAHVTSGADLLANLLPSFRDADSGHRIHGQVAAGWYPFPTDHGLSDPVAVSFQIVSTAPRRGRRRFGLNLIGRGPGGVPLEHLFDRSGELPWAPPARWAQTALGQVERQARQRPKMKPKEGPIEKPNDNIVDQRLDGILNGLARRLERGRRARDRKTGHARRRHAQDDRPTWKAIDDAVRAPEERILYDTRRQTVVVLGQRGRAHIFNLAGKLVTSVRYSTASIERRQETGRWRPATADELGIFRRHLEAQLPASAGATPAGD